MDEVGLWVDFTHEATESPPEPEHTQRQQLHEPAFFLQNIICSLDVHFILVLGLEKRKNKLFKDE